MRSNIADYNAVVEAASKFTRSVAEGNSKYAKELFTEDACLFGFPNGKLERGSIEQFYHNVDTVGAGEEFKTRIDVLELEETLAVVAPFSLAPAATDISSTGVNIKCFFMSAIINNHKFKVQSYKK
ncbi:MAG: nuclear transport factor 2 family protein [Alloprevotella sp.]|nr:nuclear transport factor 2 family protein [Alloprevotella sp.]